MGEENGEGRARKNRPETCGPEMQAHLNGPQKGMQWLSSVRQCFLTYFCLPTLGAL